MLFDFNIRKKLLSDPKRLGKWGEKRAAKYLKGKGYKVLALNFRYSHYELDVVALSPNNSVVFVEVKTRKNEEHILATASVNKSKQKKLTVAAKVFLKKYALMNRPYRFDVVTVVLGDKGSPILKHYENAFVPIF